MSSSAFIAVVRPAPESPETMTSDVASLREEVVSLREEVVSLRELVSLTKPPA